ncbi:heavy metal translocating P-type ATPase [Lamprobacter modestohalophilus]|uniref:heavy metal translocating P-type ATPase n=1 Tax=Lamprobacter modestohalophilus TaxID=1064514 RepID=UPI002ADEC8EB|nr:heavy metal translocating P-type ATPase [Lamprobacter modestohalophilus]MEA1049558.1 heavy metal translocating P-type ATPase [Lamprobacter modestohalophilus]
MIQGRCFHCGLPLDRTETVTATVAGGERHFCCTGCKSVCGAIFAAGLDGFYRRTPEGEVLGPPPEPPKQLALYDLDEVQAAYLDTTADLREINLHVEGIHCAACVWLIETGLSKMPGVEEARVNLTGRRLRLKWDNSRQRLSSLIGRLGEIGYAAVPFDPETAEGALKRGNRALLFRMAFAAFAAMNLMWVSIALYAGADEGEFRGLFHWIGFAIATPTLIYSGWPFYRGAWLGLRQGALTMDLPIAIGASITYLYSLYVTVGGQGHVYWDTVVNFLFVILVGRFLEAMSKRQAMASTQRLLDLQPKIATVLRDGEEVVVPIRAVAMGDLLLVRPGETIPADGIVSEGRSEVDEAMLTGESEPVKRGIGDSVTAGTLNGAGVLEVRVTGLLRDTALGRIIRLVEDAQSSKAPIQSLADRIVPWFVGLTIGLALITFGLWSGRDLETALMAATSVLIITCPCAFGLATPMAIAVASGLGARYGILIKQGAVLETLSEIDHFVFDKTGTLTEGRPEVIQVQTLAADLGEPTELEAGWQPWPADVAFSHAQPELLRLVAALERVSEHPLAHAVVRLAKGAGIGLGSAEVRDVHVEPGAGISGRVDGHRLVIGTCEWLRENGIDCQGPAAGENPSALPESPVPVGEPAAPLGTTLHCAIDGVERLRLLAADRLRADAAEVVQRLQADGIRVTLLTGDREAVARRIAAQLGTIEVIADVRPEDKDRVIADLQRRGERVAMVGDGINDAPALVRADVGIAVGSGTDVSIASADIVLMSAELMRVRDAAALSRRTLRTIRQNIGLSITYNLIMVPLAMAALITPLVAAISMPLSSLAVIGNSARLRSLFKQRARSSAARSNPRG